MAAQLRVSLFFTFLWLIPALATQTCYFLDGTVAPDDVPCSPSSETSICCNKADICMSNGLCYVQGTRGSALSRGSCTDSNWGSACDAFCADYNQDSGFPVVNLVFNGSYPLASTFCCGQTAVVNGSLGCLNGDTPFTLDPGYAILGVAGLSYNTSSTSNATNTTCATSIDGTAIGVGVGVPLGVIAAGALAWGLWERQQRKRHMKSETLKELFIGVGAEQSQRQKYHLQSTKDQLVELEMSSSAPCPELMGS